MPGQETGNNFVEIDGEKFQEDPDQPGHLLLGDDDQAIPFEGEQDPPQDDPETGDDDDEEDEEEEEEGEEGEEGEKKKKGETEEGGKKPPEKKKTSKKKEDLKDFNPPIRKSVKDFIVERQQKKLEKDKIEAKKKKDELGDNPPEDDTDLDDIDPNDKKIIQKAIETSNKPVLDYLKTKADEQEVKEVLEAHPEAKEFLPKIKKIMAHPQFQGPSVEFIFMALLGEKLLLQKKRDEADHKANKKQIKGHPKAKSGDSGGINVPNIDGMKDREYNETINRIKSGRPAN